MPRLAEPNPRSSSTTAAGKSTTKHDLLIGTISGGSNRLSHPPIPEILGFTHRFLAEDKTGSIIRVCWERNGKVRR